MAAGRVLHPEFQMTRVGGVWVTMFRNIRHSHALVYPMVLLLTGYFVSLHARWPRLARVALVGVLLYSTWTASRWPRRRTKRSPIGARWRSSSPRCPASPSTRTSSWAGRSPSMPASSAPIVFQASTWTPRSDGWRSPRSRRVTWSPEAGESRTTAAPPASRPPRSFPRAAGGSSRSSPGRRTRRAGAGSRLGSGKPCLRRPGEPPRRSTPGTPRGCVVRRPLLIQEGPRHATGGSPCRTAVSSTSTDSGSRRRSRNDFPVLNPATEEPDRHHLARLARPTSTRPSRPRDAPSRRSPRRRARSGSIC